jgi:general secretion pathway protein J
MNQRHEAGFTLLETLVALVVLGLIMVGLTQGLRFGVAAWDRQSVTIDRDGALDATDRTLRTLLARMAPGDDPRLPAIDGAANQLAFTTELPDAAPASPIRLSDVAIGVDAAHRLVLRWTPHLHAKLLAPPRPQQATLLPGVASIAFGYFQPGVGSWRETWRGNDPPSLVRVHIAFTDRGRHWPDVIVAPRLQHNGDD